MGRSGIRVKIQVTIGYLIALSSFWFIAGIIVAAVAVGVR